MSDEGDSRGSSIAGGTPQWVWLLLVVAAAIVVGVLFALVGQAHAHSWYPQRCCSDIDCHQLTRAPWRYDAAGDLWIDTDGTWQLASPNVIQAEASHDGDVHACWHTWGDHALLCVFVPPSI